MDQEVSQGVINMPYITETTESRVIRMMTPVHHHHTMSRTEPILLPRLVRDATWSRILSVILSGVFRSGTVASVRRRHTVKIEVLWP